MPRPLASHRRELPDGRPGGGLPPLAPAGGGGPPRARGWWWWTTPPATARRSGWRPSWRPRASAGGPPSCRWPTTGASPPATTPGPATCWRRPRPPEWLLLLNPDTVVHPGALQALLDRGGREPRTGIVGSRLENPDGSVQDSTFRFHGLANQFDGALSLGPVSSVLRRWALVPPRPDQACRGGLGLRRQPDGPPGVLRGAGRARRGLLPLLRGGGPLPAGRPRRVVLLVRAEEPGDPPGGPGHRRRPVARGAPPPGLRARLAAPLLREEPRPGLRRAGRPALDRRPPALAAADAAAGPARAGRRPACCATSSGTARWSRGRAPEAPRRAVPASCDRRPSPGQVASTRSVDHARSHGHQGPRVRAGAGPMGWPPRTGAGAGERESMPCGRA